MLATRPLSEKALQRREDFLRLQKLGMINRQGDFYPSVHYPPITMYAPMTEEALFQTYELPGDGLLDIYAHIPFCRQRCVFCHYPVKLGEGRDLEKDIYIDAFEKEMDLYMRILGLDRLRARSILVGGGTPTFLTPAQITRFLELFTRRIDLSECQQFNYDLDPGSMVGEEGRERLRIMRSYGVNRLTIGIQSLNEEVLKVMNRPHDLKEALESIEIAQDMGYQVNIEFIFGHPGETLDNWIEVMEKAVTLGVEEIQLYRLKVEAYGDYQAPVKRLLELRPETSVSNEDQILMKQAAIDILNEAGYHENLRRVFSRKREHYSHYAHNQCCMLYDEVGFGLTAFSSMRDRFGLNTQNFDEYYRKIENGRLPLNRGIVRTPEEQMRWAIILPLKNRDVWKPTFTMRTGGASLDKVFRPKIEALKEHGLLQETDKNLALTELGCFFADEVCEQFNAPQYIPYPRSEYAEGPLNPYLNNEP